MKTILKPCSIAFSVLLFMGGTAARADSDRTIDWYLANPDERDAAIARCDNDPGHLKDDPDCINAKDASHQATVNAAKEKLDNAGGRVKDAFHDLTK